MRRSGMVSRMRCVASASGGFTRSNSSVAMGPGPTAFTVMPSAASSSARVRVSPCSADLLAA